MYVGMYVCMYVCMPASFPRPHCVRFSQKRTMRPAKTKFLRKRTGFPGPRCRFLSENVHFGLRKPRLSEDAPRERDFLQNFGMFRMGARFLMNKRRNFEDAPRGSAIFIKIFRMPRTGACFFFHKFSRCSAWECDFLKIFKMLRTGA